MHEKGEEFNDEVEIEQIEKRVIEMIITKFFNAIYNKQGLYRAKFFLYNPGGATWGYEFNYEKSAAIPFHLEKLEYRIRE
jgi:hypothetical protein